MSDGPPQLQMPVRDSVMTIQAKLAPCCAHDTPWMTLQPQPSACNGSESLPSGSGADKHLSASLPNNHAGLE